MGEEPSHTFLLMLDEDGVMILQTCEWLKAEPARAIQQICTYNDFNLSKGGYRPAFQVCDKTCSLDFFNDDDFDEDDEDSNDEDDNFWDNLCFSGNMEVDVRGKGKMAMKTLQV